jgi:hypothetical protein
MSLAASFLLAAAAAAQAGPPHQPSGQAGAQVESARVSATILRSAEVVSGVLISGGRPDAPYSQSQSGRGYVTYLFE